MTGREIAALVGYSPQAVLDSLNRLENMALVHSKRAGRAKLYRVNNEHWFITYALIPLWEKIDGWAREIGTYYTITKKLKPKPLSIIMFGSFARGDETLKSDLDLLFVYKDNEIKSEILDKLLSLNSDIFMFSGHNPSPKIVSVKDFKQSVKEKKGFMRNIFVEGKTIYGLTPSEVLSYDAKEDKNSAG